jgi:hypothetical protein
LLQALKGQSGVAEDLNEAIGGNYLYHATNSLKDILASGQINKSDFQKQQDATRTQTKLPTFSVTRDWNYAVGGQGTEQVTGTIGRSAIIVLNRNAVESNFKTLGTSQTTDKLDLRGTPHPGYAAFAYDVIKKQPDDAYGKKLIAGRKKAATPDNTITPRNKIGQEFEEVVVVPKGSMPIKGTMVGFYIPPSSPLMKDPEIVNDPRRLDLAPGGTGRFVKAAQQQGVTEGKGLAKKIKIVKGPDAGKTGWIREIKRGAFKGAAKSYYIDLDDGGQANNIPGTALRLVKDPAVAEGRAGVDDTDTVGFSVNSEAAYTAVMKRFGDVIDHDETSGIMYAPAGVWPRIEMTAFDADPDSGAVRVDDDMMEAERNEMDTPAVQAALAKMAERHKGEKWSKEQLAALGKRIAARGQKSVKEDDVEDFLARGGKITQVKPNRGPRNPGLSLGSRHIGGGGDGARASRTGRGSKPQGKPVVAVESVTKEDIITKLKARLGDYLSDIGKEIKKDPDLVDKLAAKAPGDQMGPPVKTITTDDGHQIQIHGNEDDGFRISIKNKSAATKFKNLDEAVMACEMYCAQRRKQTESADYIDEAGKDACYHKVKGRYKIWPSAYASGALVRCRKVGAANWGNKSKK